MSQTLAHEARVIESDKASSSLATDILACFADLRANSSRKEPEYCIGFLSRLRLHDDAIDRNHPGMHDIVARCIECAPSASISELVSLMELLGVMGLRTPLRDVCNSLASKLSLVTDISERLSIATKVLSITGRGQIYRSELFDLCAANAKHMDNQSLAIFTYETGRHGLRCKHNVDQALEVITRKSKSMTKDELMLVWYGLSRFPRDWRGFFDENRTKAAALLPELTIVEIAQVVRAAKDLRKSDPYIDLLRSSCLELLKRPPAPLAVSAQVLTVLDKHAEHPAECKQLVQRYLGEWRDNILTLETDLSIMELIDGLDCYTSWGLVDDEVFTRVCDIFITNSSEIKYSPNVGLWHLITQCLSRVNFKHETWLLSVLDFARDRFMLDRISVWQMGTLLGSLVHLGYYEPKAFSTVLEAVSADIDSIKCLDRLCEAVYPVAWAGHRGSDYFVDLAFNRAAGLIRPDRSPTMRGPSPVKLVWAAAVLGKLDHPAIPALLNTALASDYKEHPLLHEFIEVAILEKPDLVKGFRPTSQTPKDPVKPCSRVSRLIDEGKKLVESINSIRRSRPVPLPLATLSNDGIVSLSPRTRVLALPDSHVMRTFTASMRGAKQLGLHLQTGKTIIAVKLASFKGVVPVSCAVDLESLADCVVKE